MMVVKGRVAVNGRDFPVQKEPLAYIGMVKSYAVPFCLSKGDPILCGMLNYFLVPVAQLSTQNNFADIMKQAGDEGFLRSHRRIEHPSQSACPHGRADAVGP